MKIIQRKAIMLLLLSFCFLTAFSQEDIEEKINSLISKMTLEEKLGQMNQLSADNTEANIIKVRASKAGSILSVTDPSLVNRLQKIAVEETRLGIPLIMGRDVIHGFRTIFPIPLGQAATFNPEIVEKGARISAIEASAAGIRWTFAPMIDVAQDARWGRIAESPGEDPYLISEIGAAMVRGFQGENMNNPTSIAACAKHFAGYGAAEGGRDYNSTFISERRMRNLYLKPFKAVAEAGCATYMTSFNDNDGIPASANKFLMKQVLRDEWGFEGFVVSDWEAITEMIEHGFCVDRKDAAMKAANAYVDMEMVSESYLEHLPKLIEEGKVSMELVNNAVRNILRIKFRLGLFENPYTDESRVKEFYAPEHLNAACETAEQSIVLLKNDNVLPLSPDMKKLAVIGPLADAPHEQMGTWVFDGDAKHTVTPLTALKEAYGKQMKIVYAPGLAYSRDISTDGIMEAVNIAKDADAIVVFIGEESILSGEAHSLANLNLQGAQSQLVKALSETNKLLVMVVMAGRPLVIAEEFDLSGAVLYAWHPGTMGGPAIANLLFGKAVPSGKLPVTFPRATGQVPIYYNHNNTGRPAEGLEIRLNDIPVGASQTSLGNRSYYLDQGHEPFLPFGYGLSYASFDYGEIHISKLKFKKDEVIRVNFELKNTSNIDGVEVVQLYTRDIAASITRPVKELKLFERVFVKAGKSKMINLELSVEELAFWNIDMKYVVEPGYFDLMVGSNSRDVKSVSFEVVD